MVKKPGIRSHLFMQVGDAIAAEDSSKRREAFVTVRVCTQTIRPRSPPNGHASGEQKMDWRDGACGAGRA
eukprot:6203550-Pleurochrysis_carterae.AAC.2